VSTSRERILARLRAAATPAPASAPVLDEATVFADQPATVSERRELFRKRLAGLAAELVEVPDLARAARALAGLLGEGRGRVAAERFDLLEAMIQLDPALESALSGAFELPVAAASLAEYEVGITSAERLVARTGSIFLRSDRSGGRALSVLPPTHIVIARADQLVGSLAEVLDDFGQHDAASSFATFITGPSRTADIEKILVLGAHGPKRLVVFLVDT
jgi:L-lactate dehydrogenase complex protein LldG